MEFLHDFPQRLLGGLLSLPNLFKTSSQIFRDTWLVDTVKIYFLFFIVKGDVLLWFLKLICNNFNEINLRITEIFATVDQRNACNFAAAPKVRATECVMSSLGSCNGLFNFSTGDCNCNLRALDFLLQRCDLPVIGAAAQLSMQLEADNYANKTGHDSSEVACMGVQFLSSPMTLWRLCVPAGTSGSWQRASAAQQESVTMFHPRASAP